MTDNKELFAARLQEQMTARMKQLSEKMVADRMMLTFDGIAMEAVRLKIESWDQITFAELRERIRVARAKEREALGLHKAEGVKP